MNQGTANATAYAADIEQDEIKHYPFFSSALKYGVIAGGLIAAFFFTLQSNGAANAIGLKYLGYGILGLILAIAIGDYDRFLKTGKTFKHGMKLGVQVSLIAGITLMIINLVTFLLGSGLTFSKYGMEASSFSGFTMLGLAIALEILVAGVIFTFIALQYYKSRSDYDG